MIRPMIPSLSALTLMFTWSAVASAHCQIPCGIYDDELRALLIEEHIGTVEKSMTQIVEIATAETPDPNQLVRWVNNKDEHADAIVEIVTHYFMSQRLKPADLDDPARKEAYVEQLTLLHAMMVHAMKAKQTTDPAHVDELRRLLEAFEISYFGRPVERG